MPALDLRASPRSRWLNLAFSAVLVSFVLGQAVLSGDATRIVIMAVSVAVVIAPVLWHVYRLRVVLTDTEIGVTGLFGRFRTYQRAEIGSVVRATCPRFRGPPAHNVFLLDRSGTRLLRLVDTYFTHDDLDRLVELLGVPVTAPPGVVSGKWLDDQHPGVVPWGTRRPYLAALAVVGAFLGLTAVYAAVL
jgi:hypothetical protein